MKSDFRRVPAYTSHKLIKQSFNGRKRVIWVHFLWYYGISLYMTMFVTSFLLLFVPTIFIIYYFFGEEMGRGFYLTSKLISCILKLVDSYLFPTSSISYSVISPIWYIQEAIPPLMGPLAALMVFTQLHCHWETMLSL